MATKTGNGRRASKPQRQATPRAADRPVPAQESNVARTARGQEADDLRQQQRQDDAERGAALAQQASEAAAAADEEAKANEPQKQSGEVYEFVLLSGDHTENGITYSYSRDQETIVTSPKRLDQVFMNKFRFLGGPTSPGRDYKPAFDRAGLEDPPLAERLPHGQATQFSRDTDLTAVEALAQTRGGGTAAQTNMQGAQGEDVTDDFEGARDADLVVFKQGKQYCVYDKDEQGSPLNEDTLTRKEDVVAFIKDATE